MPWAKNVYWMYSVLIKRNSDITREYLAKQLSEVGIDSRPFFYPVHVLPPYKENSVYPIAEQLSQEGLNLPSSVKLSDENLAAVVNVVVSCLQNR